MNRRALLAGLFLAPVAACAPQPLPRPRPQQKVLKPASVGKTHLVLDSHGHITGFVIQADKFEIKSA